MERSVSGGGWSLSAGALAVPAPWPAAGPTLAFLQLLLGPANAAFSSHLLLCILDPADELVSGQRRDVLPSTECGRVGDQRLAQVCGKLVHHPTGHSLAAHRATVAVQGQACFANSAAPIADSAALPRAAQSSGDGRRCCDSTTPADPRFARICDTNGARTNVRRLARRQNAVYSARTSTRST